MKPTNHKVLLIGEAPNGGGLRSHLLESILLRAMDERCVRTCSDVARAWLAFMDEPRLVNLAAEVRHVNMLEENCGSDFDAERARTRAEYLYLWLMRRPSRYPYLLLAGQRVAQVMGYDASGNPPFVSFRWAGRCACVVPHPSGVNRWWNDAGNRRKALRYLLNLGELVR